jgi:Xaa-Pro dipeptidase
VKKSLKPGVNYGDMHLLAERIMVKHLWDAQLLIGDIDEINQHRIGSLFFPVIIILLKNFSMD